MFSNWWI